MNTERTEKFVNAIACDLEEGGFRQVSGTTLRRTLATAVSAALPLLEAGNPVSGLAEQQGAREQFEAWQEGFFTFPLDLSRNSFGSYELGLTSEKYATWKAGWQAALSATGKQQVGEVQGDARAQFEAWAKARGFVDFAIYSGRMPCQEGEYQASHLEALWQGWQAALAARQPGADEPVSPMAKMAAALREKAAIEHTEYSQRVQSGEWGTIPEAGTQADFCRYCEGSGWGGESRKTKCPACSGTGMPVPPAQGIDPSGGMAQEYQRWIDFYHAGEGSYGDFLSKHVLIDDQRDAAPGVDRGE